MGLVWDLQNMNLEKITIRDLKILSKRGAYPIIKSGKITGFDDKNGNVLMFVK